MTYVFADIIGGTADYAEFLGDVSSAATVLMNNADTLPAGSRTYSGHSGLERPVTMSRSRPADGWPL